LRASDVAEAVEPTGIQDECALNLDRSWTERAYPKLIYFNKLDKGGHFAAWEQPELFARKCAPRSVRCGATDARKACRPDVGSSNYLQRKGITMIHRLGREFVADALSKAGAKAKSNMTRPQHDGAPFNSGPDADQDQSRGSDRGGDPVMMLRSSPQLE